MIATEVASPFLTPFKLALVSAVFLAMPMALYHRVGSDGLDGCSKNVTPAPHPMKATEREGFRSGRNRNPDPAIKWRGPRKNGFKTEESKCSHVT